MTGLELDWGPALERPEVLAAPTSRALHDLAERGVEVVEDLAVEL